MKFIAFYLPQYHIIPENNMWWGDNFTDWENVKKAKQMHLEQYQPRIPLNNNYYDLSELDSLKWQISLANEYNVDGFCFYHYWFKGKKLLEKPLEIFLENKTLNKNFCLSWANEPWTRSWDGKEKNILIDQEYGSEEDWKKHFEYLLKFFKDKRYIKKDNKPVFIIYRTNNIPNCYKMIEYFNKLAKMNDFDGIYLIETLNSFQKRPVLKNSQALLEFEPMYTIRHGMGILYNLKRYVRKKLRLLDIVNYENVMKKIIKRKENYNKNVYFGAFTGWDNTPRKKDKGLIITQSTPEKFETLLNQQISKSKEDFIFINAWNEWAEGAYLEPDNRYKYQYLEKIKKFKKDHIRK